MGQTRTACVGKSSHLDSQFALRQTAAAALVMLCSVAVAQEKPADEPKKTETVEKVVITGTSIRGIAPVGSSLTAVSKADITATAATTSTELLRSVPEMGNFNSTGINMGQNQANFVDQPAIHGIGVGNGGAGLTLVLFDGYRLPGAGINQTAPDAGAIAASALGGVEVMADGGSAVYGSDAVAGVVNFTSRKSLNGAETNVRFGAANGYRTKNASQLFGTNWDSGNLLLAFEHADNSSLNGTARPYFTANQTAWGGPDARSTTCSPANVTVGAQTFALSATGAAALGSNKCDSTRANDIYPQQRRDQFFGKVTQEVADGVNVFARVLYSGRTMEPQVAGQGIFGGGRPLSVTVTSASPYYIQMPGTAAGADQTVTYDPSADFGPNFTNKVTTRTLSTVVGAEVEIGEWNATLAYNQGLERDDVRSHGLNQGALINAVAAGTFNPYGIGAANTKSVLDAVGNFEDRYYARQTLKDLILKADGPIYRLPGGTVRGAFGLERRTEGFEGLYQNGNIGALNAPTATQNSERSSTSAFGELFIPLVGAGNAFTGVNKFVVSAAVRTDRYNDVGSTTNPKLGFTWTVVPGADIRFSAGKSFHAPSLADAGTAIDTRLIPLFCQVGCATAPFNNGAGVVIAGGNGTLKPESAKTYNIGFDLTPALFNTGLKASMSFFRVDYKDVITYPGWNPGPIYTDNAFYAKYQTVRAPGTTDAAWAQQLSTLFGSMRWDGQPIPPQFIAAVYDLRRYNFSDQYIRGLDYNIGYRFKSGVGDFNVGIAGTRMTRFEEITAFAQNDKLDTSYAVKNKYRAQAGWTRGDFAVSGFYNFTDGWQNGTQRVSSFKTIDLHASWKVFDKTTLSLDVSNLADKAPPIVYGAVTDGVLGYSPANSSAIGRMTSIALQKVW